MPRGRWVFDEDLSRAMWQQILRGPRPSVQWLCNQSNANVHQQQSGGQPHSRNRRRWQSWGTRQRVPHPSWADCPNGAETAPRSRSLHRGKAEQPAQDAVPRGLNALPGFTPPSWHALALGARPPPRDSGWQHETSSRTECQCRDRLFLTVTESERAMVRSQGGPGAGVPFTVSNRCRNTD